jgi:predicted TPR repeat methyltransferase
MVAQAAVKGLYDRLVTADITKFLADAAGNAAQHHLVLAADVFVYVNDLAPIMKTVGRVLAPDGVFTFSVETHSGDGVKLLPTLRYAHGAPYVRRALAEAGLALASIAPAALRSEKGVPVESLVVVAGPLAAHSRASGNPVPDQEKRTGSPLLRGRA